MRTLHFIFLALSLTLGVGGCAWLGKTAEQHPKMEWSAKRYYSEAKAALEAGNYQKAIDYYQQIQALYPFGIYAQQALLESAYAYYKLNKPESALAALDRFIRLYPLNPHLAYAYYLKGLVNANRDTGFIEQYIPLDESQRDPSSAQAALKNFKTLLERFPKSKYAKAGAHHITQLRHQLAKHEINIARYYMKRGAYIGAISRAQYVLENYPNTSAVPKALTIMARGYKILGLTDLAHQALQRLKSHFPDYPGIARVQQLRIVGE